MILPGMGIISEVIPTFSRKSIFGYKAIVYSSLAIAIAGSLVWAHHMYTSGMSDTAVFVFSLLTFVVAIPSAIKVFSWVSTNDNQLESVVQRYSSSESNLKSHEK